MQKVAAPLIGANDDVEAIEGKRNYCIRGQQQQKILLATFALSKWRDTNHLCMSLKELFNGEQRFLLSTIVIVLIQNSQVIFQTLCFFFFNKSPKMNFSVFNHGSSTKINNKAETMAEYPRTAKKNMTAKVTLIDKTDGYIPMTSDSILMWTR